MVLISAHTRTLTLCLLLFLKFMGTSLPIYTTNLAHNSASNAPNPTNFTTPETNSSSSSDPVAQKILQLFAASILAFGTLVADPHNPSNIKSALFSMATCWYKIFMTATAPEVKTSQK